MEVSFNFFLTHRPELQKANQVPTWAPAILKGIKLKGKVNGWVRINCECEIKAKLIYFDTYS